MKQISGKLISFIPLVVGITILIISALFVPWDEVRPYWSRLSGIDVTVLIFLSALYYVGRALRYWLILRMLGQPMSVGRVILATVAAQPVAILPAGEIYRSAMLKRYGNVDLKDGIPSVFAQSVAETIGLLIIAIIGATFLHQYAGFVIAIAALMIAVFFFIHTHSVRKSHRALNKLPKVSISFPRLKNFIHKNRILLTGSNFLKLLLISYIGTFAGIGIVWFTVYALGNHSFSLFESSVAYTLPLMLQSLSFLPGGIGVNEQGSVGIFVLFGIGLPLAVAATIVIRIFTLGMGFLFGFTALAIGHYGKFKKYV